MRLTLSISVAVCASLFSVTSMRADDATLIRVTEDQRISITGEHASLRKLLEELGWRAGIEVQALDAEDEPVSIELRDRPAFEVLQRLLRGRSFLVGVEPDENTGENRITWLRVLGSHESASARRSRGTLASEQSLVNVPPALLDAAFKGGDAEGR